MSTVIIVLACIFTPVVFIIVVTCMVEAILTVIGYLPDRPYFGDSGPNGDPD